jgi:uncharacterized membrane protein YhaH (DUF805 family)
VPPGHVAAPRRLAAPPLGFVASVQSCLRQYAGFTGRASRAEYWQFSFFTFLAGILAGALDTALDTSLAEPVVTLGLLLPSLAVAVRRLHDVGRSGWWNLLAFTGIGLLPLLYWQCEKGKPHSKYAGPVP